MVHLDDSNQCIESASGKARTNSAQTVLMDDTSFGSRPGLVSLRNTRNTMPTATTSGARRTTSYHRRTDGNANSLQRSTSARLRPRNDASFYHSQSMFGGSIDAIFQKFDQRPSYPFIVFAEMSSSSTRIDAGCFVCFPNLNTKLTRPIYTHYSPVPFIMAALRSRYGHYIFAL